MRNLLLSTLLIAVPVGAFAAGYLLVQPSQSPSAQAAAQGPSLGDMTPFATIITDVQSMAASGDLGKAERRITDFETAWDDAQQTLRPVNTANWGNVDVAADAVLDALRASKPDPLAVESTLSDLQAELADPSRTPGSADSSVAPDTVAVIVTTDANGRALPCEVMLETFRAELSAATLSDDTRAAATALQATGMERCNADDDKRADEFFAQGLALMHN